MKTITIAELHERTGDWVRSAAEYGEVGVTDGGKTIAKIVPESAKVTVGGDARPPYFANRRMSPEFAALQQSGRLRGGTDVTQIISEDRDRDVL